ncbi:putative lipid II flippase FtsW [bacterium]|nr:putative lipid II flippase FtsW [bacterium]
MAARVIPLRAGRRVMRAVAAHERRSARLVVAVMVPVVLLAVVGLGSILSASSAPAWLETGDGLYYFKRQAIWMGAGAMGLLVAALMPPRWWRKLSFPMLGVTLILLAVVKVAGTEAYGATRWLFIGPLSIQPSEMAKLATILALATVVSRSEDQMTRFRDLMLPVALTAGLAAGFVLAQPDLGTTVIIGAGAFAVLFASAAPMRHVIAGGAMAAAAGLVFARIEPYRWARVTSFLDLQSDPLGSGYQAVQSLVALGTGGMFGVGLGASRARWFFLPNAHTDFIFAIIGEETGLAGSLTIVVLFMVLTAAGIAVAAHASDRFGRLVAIGITTWLVTQALVNIGGVTGILPITGVPLPFVSFGGNALLTEMIAIGILISIVRQPPATEVIES